jgi:DNA polymerase-3 subunit epsilon
VWLKLTDEAYPRLSIVRVRRADGAAYLGPLRSQRQAEAVRDAIHDAVPLRQCSDRLSLRRAVRAACALAGIGRCAAPCEGGADPGAYDRMVELVRGAWAGDVRPLVGPLQTKLDTLSRDLRFEQAAVVRDRIATVVRACARMQRLHSLISIDELVAALPDGDGGWQFAVVRCGRLAAAGTARRGVAPMPVVDALRATADAVDPQVEPLAEETECVLRWLEQPGVRLVTTSTPWALPAHGAGGLVSWLATDAARRAASPFADRRVLPMVSRPARAFA